MLIKITEKHIKNGIVNAPFLCPIALAFQDLGHMVYVSGQTVSFCEKVIIMGEEFCCPTQDSPPLNLPLSARDFIRDFDDKRVVVPFEFKI